MSRLIGSGVEVYVGASALLLDIASLLTRE
jgi:hypothetical protein